MRSESLKSLIYIRKFYCNTGLLQTFELFINIPSDIWEKEIFIRFLIFNFLWRLYEIYSSTLNFYGS